MPAFSLGASATSINYQQQQSCWCSRCYRGCCCCSCFCFCRRHLNSRVLTHTLIHVRDTRIHWANSHRNRRNRDVKNSDRTRTRRRRRLQPPRDFSELFGLGARVRESEAAAAAAASATLALALALGNPNWASVWRARVCVRACAPASMCVRGGLWRPCSLELFRKQRRAAQEVALPASLPLAGNCCCDCGEDIHINKKSFIPSRPASNGI